VSRLNSSNTPDHPVLLALSVVHKATPLRSYNLKRILDAREADVLSSQPPLTLGDLEQYAESTASQLLYLQLATAGGCCAFEVYPGTICGTTCACLVYRKHATAYAMSADAVRCSTACVDATHAVCEGGSAVAAATESILYSPQH
jgi:hypothetical protein